MKESPKLKVGHRYRLVREGKAVSVDACDPACVKLADDNGDTSGYIDTANYEVTDLGVVFEKGYYRDIDGRFWYYSKNVGWRQKSGTLYASEPHFPVFKVTIGTEAIDV